LPYYFTKPINRALIKLAGQWDLSISEAVKRVVRERLEAEGLLPRREECFHKEFYASSMKRKHYVSVCSACGMEIHAETLLDLDVRERSARKAAQRKCRHEWEYAEVPGGEVPFRDPKTGEVRLVDVGGDRVPVKCRRCGVDYSESEGWSEPER